MKCAWHFRGGYRIFQKGGLRPAIRKAGGGGGGVRFRSDTKSGGGVGGGAVRFRPDTKSGGGGGGGEGDPQLGTNDTWDWDKDTLAKAQGMMAALTTFQNIAVFIITKNTLDIVKVLSVQLQKRDQDVLEAYAMIDDVMKSLKSTRTTIDTVFES